ncbi:MAG TPA: glycoside hydrolase family 3 N-terminal domain-containing protein [Acidimicrobiia bacterium]|nr:glycoside hydrolase family 3 N-terminal domain-containing protein [Acidimicrobiia bacterium]
MSRGRAHLMVAFEGLEVPAWLDDWLGSEPPAGVSLFREHNMRSPDQVVELVSALQRANSSDHPLLIAVDQEGGQLTGLVGSTPFAGNMALGAAGDTDLTRRVARAMGEELSAVGVNLNYAPVADVASRPGNPSLGVRSFGEDPDAVAAHVSAAVQGLVGAGVLCTLKHFPGKGEAVVDPHYELPRLDLDRGRLDSVELAPFRAGISAGADLVMTGHYAVPALTGHDDLPVSMSRQAIDGFIRSELGFEGMVITDALDMGALDQGAAQVVDLIASMSGGTDLLLCMPDEALRERAGIAVERGVTRGLIPAEALQDSARRIAAARARFRARELDPSVVGSNLELAEELARRSVTMVRDDAGLTPIRLESDATLLVLEPEPTNVTPADTTALYPPGLAAAIRTHHSLVEDTVYPHDPGESDIVALVDRARGFDLVVAATVNATKGQADLVRGLLQTGVPVATVSLREPQDLASYPGATTHVCTYSGHIPSLRALASALFGETGFEGRLPVAIPGLHPIGHGG